MELMLIKIQELVLIVQCNALIATQLITVLHARLDIFYINLNVSVIQVFVNKMVTIFLEKFVCLANLLVLNVQAHQLIAHLVYLDTYFMRMNVLHNVQIKLIDKIHNA